REAPLPLQRCSVRRPGGLSAAWSRRGVLRRGGPGAQPPPGRDRARLGGRAPAARARGGAVPRLPEPARGGGARRPGVLRAAGLCVRARVHRRARRPERADHERARLRDGRKVRRYRALAPQVEPVSTVGSGDVLVAGFAAARLEGRSLEDALRAAVAAGAASTLELGAGRLDPRVASQLTQDVQLTDFEAVTSER